MERLGKYWNHGLSKSRQGNTVFKLHGSIDWIVAHREESFSKLDLIFDKKNHNKTNGRTGYKEDDYRLWRCRDQQQLSRWISGRDIQMAPQGASPSTVGIAGLGTYKPLHLIPGLGEAWVGAMQAIYEADRVIVVGFSMSDFDALAQLHFGDVARGRHKEGRVLNVTVIDPFLTNEGKDRFKRVFRSVEFVDSKHEDLDWSKI